MMNKNNFCKVLGTTILSFGIGILLSFFLPTSILAILEALVIITIGVLIFIK